MKIIIILLISSSVLSFTTTETDGTRVENTVFTEIVDQDSVTHWYRNLYEGENWCYLHSMTEEVRIVRSKLGYRRREETLNDI